jgi:hypothetical protein
MNNHYYKTQLLFNKLEQLKQYQLLLGAHRFIIYCRNMYDKKQTNNINTLINDQNHHFSHKHSRVNHMDLHLKEFFTQQRLIFHF